MVTREPLCEARCLCAVALLAIGLAACGGGSSSSTEPPGPNQPPVADAGADFDAVERETVTFQSSTSDSDGTITSWSWEQTAGPAVTLANADTERASFTAPVVVDVAELEFTLTVNDDRGGSASDSVVATVHTNEPPQLATRFPCNGCRSVGDALSVTGTVNPGADGAYVSSVDGIDVLMVDAGGQPVEALVQTDGQWVAQNVPLPAGSAVISLLITATDRFGESGSVGLELEHKPTMAEALLTHDPLIPNRGYVFSFGNTRDRLFSIDFATEAMSLIRQFDTELGQIGTIVVDGSAGQVYLNELFRDVVAVDLTTGVLSTTADADDGTPAFTHPALMDFDPDDNRLVFYDGDLEALFTVDVETGERVIVSGAGSGSGDPFDDPKALAVDSANDVAYLQQSLGRFLSVHLVTGARALVPAGGGQSVASSFSMDFDPQRTGLAALDSQGNLFRIAISTGIGTLVSADDDYPEFEVNGFGMQLTYDALSDRYVINDYRTGSAEPPRFIAVDPGTGERTLLLGDSLGTGTAIHSNASVAIDATGENVYVAAIGSDNIVRVDLATGERHLVADNATGSGSSIGALRDIVLDLERNRALVVDSVNVSLVAVDVDSGDREVLADALVGTGPQLSVPVRLEADFENDRVYILDHGIPAILAVDLVTGERTIVSDASNAGPALVEFKGVALDADDNRLLITENDLGSTAETRLVAVDLATGDRSTISGFFTGSGPFLNLLDGLVLVDELNLAIVSGTWSFYRVDLSTGNRQIIVDNHAGNGEAPFHSGDLTYDPVKRVFYSWDANYEALLQYDLVTGDRVVVSR